MTWRWMLAARRRRGEACSGPAAVLFDMDGTLVETHECWWAAARDVAEHAGVTLLAAGAASVIGQSTYAVAEYISQLTGYEAGRIQLCDLLEHAFASRVSAGVEARPGARELLSELAKANVPMALVSAAPRQVVDLVLGMAGFEYFLVTLACEDTLTTKPAPEPYLTAARRLGADPGRCVAVEDSEAGITSARAVGCPVLAVPSGLPLTPAPGVLIINSTASLQLTMVKAIVQWLVAPGILQFIRTEKTRGRRRAEVSPVRGETCSAFALTAVATAVVAYGSGCWMERAAFGSLVALQACPQWCAVAIALLERRSLQFQQMVTDGDSVKNAGMALWVISYLIMLLMISLAVVVGTLSLFHPE
ncbi:HAD family phosphatase [Streptomyces klenkii]|uniref:HAD family hydrolase n=1 Tax=Streptomyces klenkii TaxID=1420899 RepID=UPI0033B8301E